MKAIVYNRSGAKNTLELKEIERPVPGADEVLIKVCTASVNPLDFHLLDHPLLRRVLFFLAKQKIARAGHDVAGIVETIGKNVTHLKPGDEVFGGGDGTFAEYACGRETALALKPPNVSFEQAAAVPVAGLTALQGLRLALGQNSQFGPGHKILVNGAAGGVGTFTVQIAKTFGGEVTGVCSARNVELVHAIGAHHVIDYQKNDFTESGQQYDVIFDLVANHSFSQLRRALTTKGRYIGAGVLAHHNKMSGIITGMIDTLIRSPFVSQKFATVMAKMNRDDLATIATLITQGKVTPAIDRHYTLSEVPVAVEYLKAGHSRGKVIIDIS